MYLFDSSAWLIHLFGEPGVETLNELFATLDAEIYISAVSLVEVFARVKAVGQAAAWSTVWGQYAPLFSGVLSADDAIAHESVRLRQIAATRLPTIDSLIAATATYHGLTLIHRDAHFNAIPPTALRQQMID